jgi:hypothetical protein
MVMPRVPIEAWDSYTADRVTDWLYGRKASGRYIFGPDVFGMGTNYTGTFKTHEDRLGVLQITGFTYYPRRVKLRYKLVEDGPGLPSKEDKGAMRE